MKVMGEISRFLKRVKSYLIDTLSFWHNLNDFFPDFISRKGMLVLTAEVANMIIFLENP